MVCADDKGVGGCMSDEASLLSAVIIDGLDAALIRPPSASKRRLSQGRPLAFGWLAAERVVAHPREPGTLITALTHSQLSASPLLLCLLPSPREERLLLFHTHLLVLSSSRRRLLSVPSLFGTLSPRSFTLPLPVRSPSTLCLCAHVACCCHSQLRVVVCPTYLFLSIYFFDQLSYHLFPSRLRLSSQRVPQDKKVFEPVPFVRSAHSHQTSISLSQPPNLLAVSSALPRFHSPIFAYFTFPPLFL